MSRNNIKLDENEVNERKFGFDLIRLLNQNMILIIDILIIIIKSSACSLYTQKKNAGLFQPKCGSNMNKPNRWVIF